MDTWKNLALIACACWSIVAAVCGLIVYFLARAEASGARDERQPKSPSRKEGMRE